MRAFRITMMIAALLLFGTNCALLAQTDPPDRVARLNILEGSVSFLPSGGDENDWVAALVNRPLTTGDRLWADANSRAELHIGSTAIRMDSNTGISFLNLDDTTVQIRLSDGTLNVRLRRLDSGNVFEVDMPNLAFVIKRPGNYRIDAHPETSTTVTTVYQGEGEAIGGGRSWQVISDQQAVFSGTDSINYDLRDADAQPVSDFDRWTRNRDAQEERAAAAARYVSPEMTGYEDLEAYGTWREVPEYGWCWFPGRVATGWAPYRVGHWVWISPWGWTWVEDEPWGFAPFHYGRWAFYHSAWMWVPGPVVVRPVYAPALVAWIGSSGFSVAVSIGGGPVGWFPLGPREVFVPSYRASDRYVTNVNVTNTVINRTTVINVYNNRNISNITYVNRGVPNGVTVVSRDTFVNARPVVRNVVNVPPRELASAPVARNIEVAPERSSVYGPGAHNIPRPPAQIMNRSVIARQAPPHPPNHFTPPQNRPADRPANGRVNQPPEQGRPTRPSQEAGGPQQTHPSLARPAPPVRPPTEKERSDMQAKQKAWEQAHPRNNRDQSEKKRPGRP